MNDRDFSDLGNRIKDIVQDAVDTMDFHKLNQGISETIDSALEEVRGALGINQSHWNSSQQNRDSSETMRTRQRANEAYRTQKQHKRNYIHSPYMPKEQKQPRQIANKRNPVTERKNVPVLISNRPAGRISGTLYMIFGFLGTGFFGLAILMIMVLRIMGVAELQMIADAIILILLPFLTGSLILSGRGIQLKKRINRFYSYARQLRGRSYCTIRELTNSVQKNEKYVLKDLKKMIQLKMFPEGYIDEKETHLILSYNTYQQYLQAQESLKKRQQEELERKEKIQERKIQDKKSVQEQSIIEQGKHYINQIRQANEAMTGEEISNKLDSLEQVTRKIFDYVEKHPEQIEEINRFMEYYLPTTLKLVKAYEEFNAQPIQGTNISTAKKEIINTLDTINNAFANLLDSLFQDAAMDISTDISVLQTMLAQEGLTDSEFKKKK